MYNRGVSLPSYDIVMPALYYTCSYRSGFADTTARSVLARAGSTTARSIRFKALSITFRRYY